MIHFESSISQNLYDVMSYLSNNIGNSAAQCYRGTAKCTPQTYRIYAGDVGNKMDLPTLLRQMRHKVPACDSIDVVESSLSVRNCLDGSVKEYEWYLAFNAS